MTNFVAVLLTVYNRKAITLGGLHTLISSINGFDNNEYVFDIYMTDDGSTDETAAAVQNEFPSVHIIKGDGNLYWSGGMRTSWDFAVKQKKYDYFIWFNDDAMLYPSAIKHLFEADKLFRGNAIISGAFCDEKDNTSYGGWNKKGAIMSPNGEYQEIFLMNGNLVLIPVKVYEKIGGILPIYKHSLGDWDYGCRAAKAGFHVILTKEFVGVTPRHDKRIADPFLSKYSIKERLRKLYSPMHDPRISWYFNKTYIGYKKAIKTLIIEHLYVICPYLAVTVRKIQGK